MIIKQMYNISDKEMNEALKISKESIREQLK